MGTSGCVLTKPDASAHSCPGTCQSILLCAQPELSPKSGNHEHTHIHMNACTWRFRYEPCLEKLKLPPVLEFAKRQGLERLLGVEGKK